MKWIKFVVLLTAHKVDCQYACLNWPSWSACIPIICIWSVSQPGQGGSKFLAPAYFHNGPLQDYIITASMGYLNGNQHNLLKHDTEANSYQYNLKPH